MNYVSRGFLSSRYKNKDYIYVKLHGYNNNLVTIMKVQREITVRPKRWRIGDTPFIYNSFIISFTIIIVQSFFVDRKYDACFSRHRMSGRKSIHFIHETKGEKEKESDDLLKNLACSYVP